MSFKSPLKRCSTHIPTLGDIDGFEYDKGVQQYCGIQYASLAKRWTRSCLKTSWEGNYHDGTKLGNNCPSPITEGDDANDLVPVPQAPHFEPPKTDELTGLVMNIVTPPPSEDQKYPVMVYVHGGSLLYGGANLPIFDAVNLVSHSMEIGMPIICVNFNYRVGLGGFLASKAIREELHHDGYHGCGNFGFTDQQVAFEWVQRYIPSLGGDSGQVTAVGESAGGISISNQMFAAHPPTFHRAVCMSGLSVSIPPWTMEQHERLFEAVCRHFDLDAFRSDVLDYLRDLPQQDLANATSDIQGVLSGTGNPCLDGWFYGSDPREIREPPAWVQSFMLGDTYHEGIIFHINLLEDDYTSIRKTLQHFVRNDTETDQILTEYGINASLSQYELLQRVEHMCGDAIFKIPNYATVLASQRLAEKNSLFHYHFDQRSRLKNALEGTAYHAHELLYLFGNLDNELSPDERLMARDFASAWIRLCHGQAPWVSGRSWKVWGPDSIQAVMSETEDEETRGYGRMQRMLSLGEGQTWRKWLDGVDALVNKRMNLGRPNSFQDK